MDMQNATRSANAGSFETEKYKDKNNYLRGITFSWSLKEQSISENYSIISYRYVGSGDNNSKWYYTKNAYLYIDGVKVYDQGTSRCQLYYGTVLKSGEVKIKHNNDGTKSFSANGGATIFNYDTYQTGYGSWELPSIARVSKPTLSNSEIFVGDSITIYTNSESSSFKHKIYYSINSDNDICLASNVEDSYTWTIPKEYAKKILYNDFINVKLRVVTVVDNQEIGSNEVIFKLKIPDKEEFYPTINSVSLKEAGSVPDDFKKFIKGVSRISGKISAGGAYGSTISNYYITLNNESFTNADFTTNILSFKEQKIIVTVTDSRGRKKTYEKNLEVLDYEKPMFVEYKTERNIENAKKLNINFSCTIFSLENKNVANFIFYYKNSKDNTFSKYLLDDINYDIITDDLYKTYKGTFDIDIDENVSYDAYLAVNDNFSVVNTLTNDIKTAFRYINIPASRQGIALGKLHEREGYAEINFNQINYGKMIISSNGQEKNVLSCDLIDDGKMNLNQKEKTIDFTVNGKTYSITLIEKG